MFSASRPFSEADWSRINSWLDAVYADFTEKVAAGLPPYGPLTLPGTWTIS